MKKLKYFVFAILIIIGLVLFNFYISFGYGSFGDFIAEQRSLPEEEKFESLRQAAVEQLTQAHSELSSIPGLTLYEKTYSDMCEKGDHSWKRNDPYAYVCSYRLTYYYGADREYKSLLFDLEQTLNDLGWVVQSRNPEQPTISESISAYSGKIFLVELPVFVK